jgi:manganese/zinc/iron transport system permease protein
MDAFWIICTGALVAVACALTGTFLVLRRMAMIGDAVSHAVLPGIAASFLLTGSRAGLPMLIGAGSVGVLSTFLIELLHRKGRLQSDASTGVTFTALFALGVVLITNFANNVDIDPDCVLYGEIAYVPLDMVNMGFMAVPRSVLMMSGVLCIVLCIILGGFRYLRAASFDPQHAAAMGISINRWHYILMACVSLVTVASFDAVGAIIVVAFFIAPPSAALLLTSRLQYTLMLAAFLGILCAITGYILAWWVQGSVAGAMAVMAGVEIIIALIIAAIRARSMARAADSLHADTMQNL